MSNLKLNPPHSAVISDDGQYRYLLTRTWSLSGLTMLFVMLNPSTADANEDDPTIRRCINFAKREGFGGIEVVNLYAYRAKNPKELWKVFDPFGPENDEHILQAVERCDRVVAAWGANAKLTRSRTVRKMLDSPYVFGLTKDGFPKHPLYIPSAEPYSLWEDFQSGIEVGES